MGDGISKKYAFIVNGDGEARHLGNVDRAVQALRREGAYEISVASVQSPKSSVEHYEKADAEGLKKLLVGLQSKLDDDDLLVVYFTGHGGDGAQGEGCVALPGDCLSLSSLAQQLKSLAYGRRVLVMDNCYSGSGFNLFADAKTTVVSQGSPGEKVSCQLFSPYFWSDQVPDADQDGKISVQERFQHAVLQGQSASLLQFYSPEPLSFSGALAARPFRTADGKPVEVRDGKELKSQLARLKPGQLALVAFSADWCVPCKAYQPHFEKLAKQDDGRVLMIHAEGQKGSEEDWAAYGVSSFPTVAFVDWNGKVVKVADPRDPMASLALVAVHSPEEQVKIYLGRLSASNPGERYRATLGLRAMGAKAAPAAGALTKALEDADDGVRHGAALALAEIGEAAAPAVPSLLKLLEGSDYEMALAAAKALGNIGPKAKAALPALLKLFRSDLEVLAKKSVADNGLSPTLNAHMVFDKMFDLTGALVGAMLRIAPGDPQLQEAFLEIARDAKRDYARRHRAVTALGLMGGSAADAAPRLIALFDDPMIGGNCQTAVAQIAAASPATIQLLAERAAAKNAPPFHRFRLLEILGRVGAPASTQASTLWKMAEDKSEDPRLRKQALLTLRKIDPALEPKTAVLLQALEDVSLLFDPPREKSAEAMAAPASPPIVHGYFSPSLEFSGREGAAGGGFGLTAGRRVHGRFELRLGATFQAMHLAQEKVPNDFQISARFEPVLHLFGAPEKSGPSLTLGEIGLTHLFANGLTGAYLAPLGLSYSLKLGDNSHLSVGIKGQAHYENEWKPGFAGQLGWATRF